MDRKGSVTDPKIPVFPKGSSKKPSIPVVYRSSVSLDEKIESLPVITMAAASQRSIQESSKDSRMKCIPAVPPIQLNKHKATVKPPKPSTNISHTVHGSRSSINVDIDFAANQSKVRHRRSKRRVSCKVVEVKDFEAPLPQPVIKGHLPWDLEKKLESCIRIVGFESERPNSASHDSKTSAKAVDLTQPRFNSSLKLMKDLQSLKQLEIDGDGLVQNKLKSDEKLKENLQHVEATATTISPKQAVFKGLASLELDQERLISQQEEDFQKLAAKIAPSVKPKDPEPDLSNFFTPYYIPSELPLPACEDLWKDYSFAQLVRPADPNFEDGRAVYHAVTKNVVL